MEREALQVYDGGARNVVVYNTYAHTDDGTLHFDVFIPTDKEDVYQVPKEVDAKAIEYAKQFLKRIGKATDQVEITMCDRCHIDNTDAYKGQLWQLPGKEVLIWPMEGCPKPSQ